MRILQMLLRIGALVVSAGALLLANPVRSFAAQDNPPCPFTDDGVVSAALGSPVHGYANLGNVPGFETCEFGDFTLYHQSGPYVTGQPGLAAIAGNVVLGLPPELSRQISGLDAGRTLDFPGYQIATLSGLGDAALWVKDASVGVDALIVQRGNEVFVAQVLDRPGAQATSTAVVRALVASAPPAEAPGAQSSGRPEVAADCGVETANAVAERLQRSDVTRISIIGGCHYVSIETTIDGNGFVNAATGRDICDAAGEVAYGDAILGITVTDRAGHERASGARGVPCDGFP